MEVVEAKGHNGSHEVDRRLGNVAQFGNDCSGQLGHAMDKLGFRLHTRISDGYSLCR